VALCFVSIGSNIDRERNVRGALSALREAFGPLLLSSLYETTAVGFDGAPFYNLVAAFATDAPLLRAVEKLREIETAHGRTRDGVRFGPRSLDLDLLLYDDIVMRAEGIELPRPEIEKYAFVLGPLAEIAPDLRHPVRGEMYGEAWKHLPKTAAVKVVRRGLYQ